MQSENPIPPVVSVLTRNEYRIYSSLCSTVAIVDSPIGIRRVLINLMLGKRFMSYSLFPLVRARGRCRSFHSIDLSITLKLLGQIRVTSFALMPPLSWGERIRKDNTVSRSPMAVFSSHKKSVRCIPPLCQYYQLHACTKHDCQHE